MSLTDYRPWGDDRALLEQCAIASSWSSVATARELLTLPNQAWMRLGHRVVVDAIRRILKEGYEINDMAVGIEVLRVDGGIYYEDFTSIHNLYAQGMKSIDGIHRQALSELREEYEWQMAAQTVHEGLAQIRGGSSYAEWYHRLLRQFESIAPAAKVSAATDTFDVVVKERIQERLSGDADAENIETLLPELDDHLQGMRPGQMILLVGPPGMGKTTLAFQLAANLSRLNRKVLFNQLEMSTDEMADRAIAMAAKREIKMLDEDDLHRAAAAAPLLRHITMEDGISGLEEWERRTRAWLYRNPDAAVVITDYAGLLQEHGAKINPTTAANAVSDASKRIAKLHNVVHILLQQPSKQYDFDKKPSLSHIRDSGKFRQDADKVLFLHHPHHWDKAWPKDYMQLHVLKNRGGQDNVIAHLEWIPHLYLMRQWPTSPPSPRYEKKPPDAADKYRKATSGPEFEEVPLELPL